MSGEVSEGVLLGGGDSMTREVLGAGAGTTVVEIPAWCCSSGIGRRSAVERGWHVGARAPGNRPDGEAGRV
ncbi:MAG: hypothetical protein M3N18_08010 [Actinomycetota bacterium]|nr:hypothetical protein [Actinomycetota bacterium]